MVTVAATPKRSLEQRLVALQKANAIRSRRAKLKEDLREGRQPVEELLLEPPAWLHTARLYDVLLAVPKWGRVKVNRLFAIAKISQSKTVGGLSERQRQEIVVLVRRRLL